MIKVNHHPSDQQVSASIDCFCLTLKHKKINFVKQKYFCKENAA